MISILGEHRHPVDEELAAGPRPDHQDPLRADAPAPQAGLVLAQQVPLDGHQHEREDDGVDEREPAVLEVAIQRHAGQHQHRGQR